MTKNTIYFQDSIFKNVLDENAIICYKFFLLNNH